MTRSTQEVFEHHVAALPDGDIDEIMADYADDAIAMTVEGGFVGKESTQAPHEGQLAAMPNLLPSPGGLAVEGDTPMVQSSGESDTTTILEAVDAFTVRDSIVHRQTGWFKIVPK